MSESDLQKQNTNSDALVYLKQELEGLSVEELRGLLCKIPPLSPERGLVFQKILELTVENDWVNENLQGFERTSHLCIE